MTFKVNGCCAAPIISEKHGFVYTKSGWKVPYLLTACDNCGMIKSRSNFYDAKERIDEYAFGWSIHDHNEYKETQDK